MTTYYYVLASKRFLLEEEPTDDVLKERIRNYQTQNKPIDFWLIEQPAFLDAPELATAKHQVPHPAAAIVSTDQKFIIWLKLRLEHVIMGEMPLSVTDPLASLVTV
jgi:hypothetical protein